MKKIVILLALVFSASGLFAQTLFYKDVAIEGSPKEFYKTLKKTDKTTERIGENEDKSVLVLKNEFLGDLVTLNLVSGTSKGSDLKQLVIETPAEAKWSALKSKYTTYLNAYKAEYGTPTNEFKFFGIGGENPPAEMDIIAVHAEDCFYSACWEFKNGSFILLQIDKTATVSVNYMLGVSKK